MIYGNATVTAPLSHTHVYQPCDSPIVRCDPETETSIVCDAQSVSAETPRFVRVAQTRLCAVEKSVSVIAHVVHSGCVMLLRIHAGYVVAQGTFTRSRVGSIDKFSTGAC